VEFEISDVNGLIEFPQITKISCVKFCSLPFESSGFYILKKPKHFPTFESTTNMDMYHSHICGMSFMNFI
jgi:hypothetical protein